MHTSAAMFAMSQPGLMPSWFPEMLKVGENDDLQAAVLS